MSLPIIAKPTQTGAASLQAARLQHVSNWTPTMLPGGHVAAPLNGTYCLKLVPQVHFLPSGN